MRRKKRAGKKKVIIGLLSLWLILFFYTERIRKLGEWGKVGEKVACYAYYKGWIVRSERKLLKWGQVKGR